MASKPTHWRQLNAQDQYTALRSALEGHFSNFDDGIISRERLIEAVNPLLEDLRTLDPYLRGKEWT